MLHMSEPMLWSWWIAAGVVLGIELLTGTVYLLVLAMGMACAGAAAGLGMHPAGQVLICALVSGLSAGLLRRWRRRAVVSFRAIHLDVGHRVHVSHWHPPGHTTVRYRGASWQARWHEPQQPPPGPGEYPILAVDGTVLILGDPG